MLVDEEKQAGKYEVMCDASRFASGVYFYRLQAPSLSGQAGDPLRNLPRVASQGSGQGFVETKKLVVIK